MYGPKAIVEASLTVIKETLAGFNAITLDEAAIAGLPPAISTAGLPAIGLLQGTPTTVYLKGAAWRSRGAVDGASDPLDNQAGLLWAVPALPATGKVRRPREIAGFSCRR